MKLEVFINKYKFFFFLLNNKIFIKIFFKNKSIIFLVSPKIYLNKKLNCIIFLNKYYLNNKYLNYFFFIWTTFLTKKIKIRHKISWLKIFRKNNYLVRFNYGFSYNIFFLLNNIFLKKKKKHLTFSNILFWCLNRNELFFYSNIIKNFQKLNQYTMLGLKFSQQKFIKRIGKISKYNEFKVKIL